MKKLRKNLKDFLLEEDAKVSKKSLIMGGLWIVAFGLGNVAEAGHHSYDCWGWHSSSIDANNHNSAISHKSRHTSHSSY